MGAIELRSASPEETRAVGERLGRVLEAGDVVLLRRSRRGQDRVHPGARDRARRPRDRRVASPTFTLVNEHAGPRAALSHHLYRIEMRRRSRRLACANTSRHGVAVVEWAERLGPLTPPDRIEVRIAVAGAEAHAALSDIKEGDDMRILYGVVGEGMGHATRSSVILRHLLARGSTRSKSSCRAARTRSCSAALPDVKIHEIAGLSMIYEDNRVKRRADLLGLREEAAARSPTTSRPSRADREAFRPRAGDLRLRVVRVSLRQKHELPVISIDNMQIINRCRARRSRSPTTSAARLPARARRP